MVGDAMTMKQGRVFFVPDAGVQFGQEFLLHNCPSVGVPIPFQPHYQQPGYSPKPPAGWTPSRRIKYEAYLQKALDAVDKDNNRIKKEIGYWAEEVEAKEPPTIAEQAIEVQKMVAGADAVSGWLTSPGLAGLPNWLPLAAVAALVLWDLGR